MVEAGGQNTSEEAGNTKILIAEDEVVSRRMLEATLAKWGYAVVAARDGEEAWRALQAEDAPPLALLNWMMPGMDGLEVCRKVRNCSPSRPIYIILLTARGRREDVVAGLEAGADDYITKPFDRQELRARVMLAFASCNCRGTSPTACKNWKRRSRASSSSTDSSPFARTASASATTGTTGSRSKPMSPSIRRPSSRTASARIATRSL